MSSRTSKDWKLLRKRFFIASVCSLLFGVLIFFVTGFFREEHHGIVLLAAGGLLWLSCAGVALRPIRFFDVVAVAAGLAWGFLFALSAAISLQNHRVSVNWLTMIPGLMLIPLGVAVTVLPFRLFSRRRHNHAA